MAPIYKYVSEERFALALIERGQVFMQTLANFRGYEDEDVRRDPDDGRLRFQPDGGPPINFEGKEPQVWKDWRATFSVKSSDMFLYCLSTVRSEEIAERFESRFCVEFPNPMSLIGRIRDKVRLRSAMDRAIFFREVEYRAQQAPPGVRWALPEQVAFIKPEGWAWQNEFRVVVGKKGVFAVHNLDMQLQTGPDQLAPRADHDPLILTVDSLARVANLIRF